MGVGEHAYLCTMICTWGVIKLVFIFEQMYAALIHLSEPFRNLKKNVDTVKKILTCLSEVGRSVEGKGRLSARTGLRHLPAYVVVIIKLISIPPYPFSIIPI